MIFSPLENTKQSHLMKKKVRRTRIYFWKKIKLGSPNSFPDRMLRCQATTSESISLLLNIKTHIHTRTHPSGACAVSSFILSRFLNLTFQPSVQTDFRNRRKDSQKISELNFLEQLRSTITTTGFLFLQNFRTLPFRF